MGKFVLPHDLFFVRSPPVRNIHVSAHHFKPGIEKPSKSITSWLKPVKDVTKEMTEKNESRELKDNITNDGDFISSDESIIFEDGVILL